MKTADFDFDLPAELIAQQAVEPRDAARLLVAGPDGSARGAEHGVVGDLGRWLRPGDLLVLNDTRVLPARVHARRETGGGVEALFLEPCTAAAGSGAWRALVRPAKKLRAGERLRIDGRSVELVALERDGATGGWSVALEDPDRSEGMLIIIVSRLFDCQLNTLNVP